MPGWGMGKKKVTLSVDAKVYNDFRKYCSDRAIMLSKKIELIMKDIMKDKKGRLIFLGMFVFVLMMGSVSADVLFFDDFEDGDVSDWTITDGATSGWFVTTTEGPIGTNHVIARNTDSQTTIDRGVNTTGYQDIVFDFWWSIDTNNFDAGDYYYAEWYNGTGWTRVLDYTGTPDQSSYTFDSNTLPSEANDNTDFQIRFICNANLGTEGCNVDNVTVSGDVIAGDSEPPSFSGYVENPGNGSTYSVGGKYEFNVTITDIQGGSSGIEWAGVNYSLTNISDVYNFTIVALGVGNYDYYFWANDSSGNYNTSGVRGYSVVMAGGNISLLLNGVGANLSVIYPQEVNASAGTLYGSVSLYRDGGDVSGENGENVSLGVGYYNYTAVSSGDQNHSGVSVTYWVNVTFTGSEVNLTLNFSEGNISIFEGDSILLNGTLISGDSGGTLELYNSGVLINSGTGEVSNNTLFSSAGLYNISVRYVASQNYSDSWETYWVDVSVVPDTTPPYFTVIPGDVTINYTQGFGVDFDATDDIGFGSYSINWTDSFVINSSGWLENSTGLAVGTYMINVSINDTSGNENSTVFSVVVNRKVSSCSLSSGGDPEYPNPVNVSGSCDSGEASGMLFRDGVDVTSELGAEVLLGVGSYDYVLNVTETGNYSSGSDSISVVVNLGASEVNLTLNFSEGNISIFEGDSILLNGTLISGDSGGTLELYDNGTLINSGSGDVSNMTTFGSAGLYNISVRYVASQNYSESWETYWVNVSVIPDTIFPDVSIVYPGNITYSENVTDLNYTVSVTFNT